MSIEYYKHSCLKCKNNQFVALFLGVDIRKNQIVKSPHERRPTFSAALSTSILILRQDVNVLGNVDEF